MKRYTVTMCTTVFLMCYVWGCRREGAVVQQPSRVPTPPADTSFSEPTSMSIDTSDEATFREADLDEELRRIVKEKLRPVYFSFNSFSVNAEASERMAVAGAFLSERRDLRVLVQGHCDERGSAEYNLGLGENRARVVKNFLVNYGVDPVRIEVTSWGKERPEKSGCVDEGCHSRNRRAEFTVLQR